MSERAREDNEAKLRAAQLAHRTMERSRHARIQIYNHEAAVRARARGMITTWARGGRVESSPACVIIRGPRALCNDGGKRVRVAAFSVGGSAS